MDKRMDGQMDRQTDRQTNRQISWIHKLQIDLVKNEWIDRQVDRWMATYIEVDEWMDEQILNIYIHEHIDR